VAPAPTVNVLLVGPLLVMNPLVLLAPMTGTRLPKARTLWSWPLRSKTPLDSGDQCGGGGQRVIGADHQFAAHDGGCAAVGIGAGEHDGVIADLREAAWAAMAPWISRMAPEAGYSSVGLLSWVCLPLSRPLAPS